MWYLSQWKGLTASTVNTMVDATKKTIVDAYLPLQSLVGFVIGSVNWSLENKGQLSAYLLFVLLLKETWRTWFTKSKNLLIKPHDLFFDDRNHWLWDVGGRK